MSREPLSWIHTSGRKVSLRSRSATKRLNPYFAVYLDDIEVGRVFNGDDGWNYTPRRFLASNRALASRTAAADALVDYTISR